MEQLFSRMRDQNTGLWAEVFQGRIFRRSTGQKVEPEIGIDLKFYLGEGISLLNKTG